MPRTIHFVSGLPRAGSTLLVNIMGQHPDVFCTPTSGCHETLFLLRNNWQIWKEHQADKAASAPHNLARVMGAMLQAYHDTDKPVVIDKARSWIHSIEMAEAALQAKVKIIVPVRDLTEILASFETLYRKNAALTNVPGEFLTSQSTPGRADHWAGLAGEVGIAYSRIRDAIQRGYRDRLHFVEFDDLTARPAATMNAVWDFLGMERPSHDFGNVVQATREDDAVHGYVGMHDIDPTVTARPHKALRVLGEQVVAKYKSSEFWRNI